jgi:hypothetical protein
MMNLTRLWTRLARLAERRQERPTGLNPEDIPPSPPETVLSAIISQSVLIG